MRIKIMATPLVIMSIFLASAPAEAQQPKKVSRIGYLSNSDPVTESTRSEAIRRALHELGYIEGRNIGIEYRYAEGSLRLSWCVSRLISSLYQEETYRSGPRKMRPRRFPSLWWAKVSTLSTQV